MKKIAIYEPFYKGSHKYWADSLIKNSAHNIDLISKNGVFWKWRVQQSSVEFTLEEDHDFDIILSTNMVNLAAWSGINKKHLKNTELIHYFHENQLSYPVKEKQDNSFYGFIDITSALCADRVVFNSRYHQKSFLDGIEKLSSKLPDKLPSSVIESIFAKSSILPVGLEVEKLLQMKPKERKSNDVPIILWNHRHEYDKNPVLFFETLFKIQAKSIPFKLVVLGKSPKRVDPIFELAQEKLKDEILCFGAVDSFEQYAHWLWRADILPVTSNHDFFGISVLEAALCHNHLLLPNKNAYPDHYPLEQFNQHYYNSDIELENILIQLLETKSYATSETSIKPEAYSWNIVTQQLDDFLNN